MAARQRGALKDPHPPGPPSIPMCVTPIWARNYHILFVLSLFLILMPSHGMTSGHIELTFNALTRVLY